MSVITSAAHVSCSGQEQQQSACCSPVPRSASSKSACTWSVQQEKAHGSCAADDSCSEDEENYLIGTQVADGGSAECYQLFEDGMVRQHTYLCSTRAAVWSSCGLCARC